MKLILQAIKALFRKTEASVEAVRSEIPTKLSDLEIDMDVGGGGASDVFIAHFNESGDDAGEFYISESVEEVKNAIAEGKVVLLQVNKEGNFAKFVGKSSQNLYFVGFAGTATDNMNFYLYNMYGDGSCSRSHIWTWT